MGGVYSRSQKVGTAATTTTDLGQYPWPYFHNFPRSAINERMPWKLFDMQGKLKTWWIGASACFESVHDVTNYNWMLKSQLGADVRGKVSGGVTLLSACHLNLGSVFKLPGWGLSSFAGLVMCA